MKRARFEGELIAGHKGVVVALVPFDPGELWGTRPVRLEGTRHGWLIRGEVNGVAFDGYIGERWGRFFIQLEPEVMEAAKAKLGATVELAIQASASRAVLAAARAQSLATTQPKKPRPDAVALQPEPATRTRSASRPAPRVAASTADRRRSRSSPRTRR